MHAKKKFNPKNKPLLTQDMGHIPFSDRTKEAALFHIATKKQKFSSEAEKILWKHLKANHLPGMHFQRLQPANCFITGFIDVQKRIVIEIDHCSPAEDPAQRIERNIWFKAFGYKVLRFLSSDIMENIDDVMKEIMAV